ncbi:molybdenum cofactor biosynthesis protein MoaE [Lignipirellula cremea]|uniref:Molybdopterin synthase catalytic subunit n=1 Tax=Lignipirellula cremea TaxID=2528010 RepID=A0A518DVH0_9BACT|nr:molybdenum cofactor biosynthesis protein MoaE [Lignipirellula cremea]QDU95829.1 Molybdopterin synthase catalytic subunit [Lignipirellula cremea]
MVELTTEPLDPTAMIDRATSPQAGAVVLFLGTTREITGDRVTAWLDYEAYGLMAEKKLQELEEAARSRWPLVACEIAHRLGRVPLAAASVAIVVSSPHRRAAFEAGQWLIDTLKETVPIWKKENWADGSTEWVHPGLPAGDNSPSPPGSPS